MALSSDWVAESFTRASLFSTTAAWSCLCRASDRSRSEEREEEEEAREAVDSASDLPALSSRSWRAETRSWQEREERRGRVT